MFPRGLFSLWIICLLLGCQRNHDARPESAHPTVASLVPAATDILVDMGAGNHLVAVSDFDAPQDNPRSLPKVGGYETVDWERIASVHPDLMITQFAEERMPAGLRQKESNLGIHPVNLRINTLDDILNAYDTLGAAVQETARAHAAHDRLVSRLEALRHEQRPEHMPQASVLIAIDSSGLTLAGPGSFLNDLLRFIGAKNTAESLKSPYPTIDREMLHALDPDAIVQLLPDASQQVVESARQAWKTMPELRAVKSGRVFIFTDWYLLQPGAHVADIAEKIQRAIAGTGNANSA